MRKLTTKIFVERAKKTHGDKFDYSHSIYVNSNIKVDIICKKHGLFSQLPLDHTHGKGCPVCGRESTIEKKFLTQDEFEQKAKNAHGDKYDYSKAIYKNSLEKVLIICQKHGHFLQAPMDHMHGKGCPICGNEEKHNKQVMSQEEVIKICRQTNADKYSYDNFEYKNSKTKTIVTCPIHGDFLIKPESHMKGHGCIKCRNELSHKKQAFTIAKFVEKAKQIHGDKFDYSMTKYINNTTPVKIRCIKHAIIFEQYPQTHYYSATGGCPICRSETIKEKNSYTQDEILTLFREVHGDKYDYAKFIYTGITAKGIIICPIHGEFEKDPYGHIRGEGCQRCAYESIAENHKFTKEQFIEHAKEVHGELYDYSLVDYVNARTKIKIICQKHGVFEQVPYTHIGQEAGCPFCRVSHWEENIYEWIVSLGENVERRNRSILDGKEIDIYLPKRKIGIELNGCAYHTAIHSPIAGMHKGKEKSYHQQKTDLAEEKGVSLYQFWDDMDTDTIKSIILMKLGMCTKISAKNLNVEIITQSEAIGFTKGYYKRPDGHNSSCLDIALCKEDNLKAVMRFRKYKKTTELLSYDCLQNEEIIDGFSKLLSFAIPILKKAKCSEIVAYINRDIYPIAKNTLYWKTRFKYEGKLPPQIWYYIIKPIDGFNIGIYHRKYFRKQILPKYWNDCDMAMREIDICSLHGIYPIFNSGFYKFTLNI